MAETDKQIREGALRKSLIDFSGGINCLGDPTKILENQFKQFTNFIIYKRGNLYNAVMRGGFNVLNAYATLAGTQIIQLIEFISVNKLTNVNQIVVRTNSSLEYFPNGGTAFVNIDNSTSFGTIDWVTYLDNLFMFPANTVPKVWTGSALLDAGIEPCPQSFQIASSTTGTPTGAPGFRNYLITFIYDNNEESFVIARSAALPTLYPDRCSTISTSPTNFYGTPLIAITWYESGSGTCFKLSGIPTGNARVKARRIYRSSATANNFKLLTEIKDNTTTEFYDGYADSELTTDLDISTLFRPPKAKLCIEHKSRLFIANITDDVYNDTPTKPAVDQIESLSTGTGGGFAVDPVDPVLPTPTRKAKYDYQFAFLKLIHSTFLYTSGFPDGYPCQALLGPKSTTLTFETTNVAHNKIHFIAGIGINKWYGRTAVFRNTIGFPHSYTNTTGDIWVIGFHLAVTGRGFKVGETITLESIVSGGGGGGGFPSQLNGTAVITAVDLSSPGSITIEKHCGDVPDADTGLIRGSNMYYIGHTACYGSTYAAEFYDTVDDASAADNSILKKYNTEDYKANYYSSMIKWTPISQTDNYTGEMDIAKYDCDQITGLISDDDGIYIFKERNVYKLFTTSEENYWEYRKVLTGIGCSDRNSVISTPHGVIIFRSNNDIYIWRGMGTVPVKITDKLYEPSNSIAYSKGFYDRNRNWGILIYGVGSSRSDVHIYVFDFNFTDEAGIPAVYYLTQTGGLHIYDGILTKDDRLIFAMDNHNKLYKYFDNSNYDVINSVTTDITSILETKNFDFDRGKLKRIIAKSRASGTGANYLQTIKAYCDGVLMNTWTDTINDIYGRGNHPCNYNFKEMSITLSAVNQSRLTAVTFSVKELSFDYLPEHTLRGAF